MKSKICVCLSLLLTVVCIAGCGKKVGDDMEVFSITEEIPEVYEWIKGEEKYTNLCVETAGGEKLPELTISVYRADERITKDIELPVLDVDLIKVDSDSSCVQYLFEVYTGWWIITVEADGYDRVATYFEVNDEISIYSFTAVIEMEDEE